MEDLKLKKTKVDEFITNHIHRATVVIELSGNSPSNVGIIHINISGPKFRLSPKQEINAGWAMSIFFLIRVPEI